MENFFICILISMLAVASFVVADQHEKVKQKVYKRAEHLGCDLADVGAVLDTLLGRELRDLCALSDDDFIKVFKC